MTQESAQNQLRLFTEKLPAGIVLVDSQIRDLVSLGTLIDRENFDDRGLDSCSYDVRIGDRAVIGGSGTEIDLNQSRLELTPGCYAAVVSLERVLVPDDILVRINSKRSFSYKGIALLTGSQVDPGYQGHLLFGFYNASSKRIVLGKGEPICSLVFETLAHPVAKPKGKDPYLYRGEFPAGFVDFMANMEVLSWHQLSEHVKKIEGMTQQILDLRSKYENVIEPIKDLTGNVDRLTQDVDKLSSTIETVGRQVGRLESLSGENMKQINEVSRNVLLLTTEIVGVKRETERVAQAESEQNTELQSLKTSFGRFSILVYIFWALLAMFLGGILGKYVL
ncbi:MAG: hypothetical protein HYV26_22850 [Candidatus Hydrogenedentes bacterium]|nr:hypothetical protein [Candidatus Hydrogenedentota bacterium]